MNFIGITDKTKKGQTINLGNPDLKDHYTLPFKTGETLIELGGGVHPAIRPNVDIRSMPTVDLVADFNEPLPLLSDHYDGVYSKFVIEHIGWRNVKQFISEIFRILKPKGYAVICTTNLLEQAKVLIAKSDWLFGENSFVSMIFGNQDFPANTHKSNMTPYAATNLFREAGFINIRILPMPASYIFGPEWPIDMIIEAQKPDKGGYES